MVPMASVAPSLLWIINLTCSMTAVILVGFDWRAPVADRGSGQLHVVRTEKNFFKC